MKKKMIKGVAQTDNRTIAKMSVIVISTFITGYMLYTYVMAAKFTFFLADDFDHAVAVGVQYHNLFEAITASFDFMVYRYQTWQGTYFSMYMQALLSPLNGLGIIQMKLIMVLNICMLFGAVFLLFCAISKYIFDKVVWHYVMPAFSLYMFAANAYKAWEEVYYWFSGATSYSIPFVCMCLAMAFYLLSNKCKHRKTQIACIVVSSINIFCSSGGTLAIAGTGCYLILLLALYESWKDKKVSGGKWSVFAVGLIGALINTAAPGNYVRYDEMDKGGLHIKSALICTRDCVLREIDWLLNETSFMAVIVLVVAIGVFAGRYIICKKNEVIIFTVALIMTPFVAVFPVALAYGESYFPNRCQFVLDFVLMGVCVSLAFVFGYCLNSVFCESREKLQIATICILLSLVAFSGNERYDVENLVMVYTKASVDKGVIEGYSNCCKMVCDEIASSPEANVVLTNFPSPIAYYAEFKITNDITHYLNTGIADYYGKDSVIHLY